MQNSYNRYMKIQNKALKISLKIFTGLIVSLATIFVLAVIVFNIFTKAPAAKALRNSKKAFSIPYSNKGYIAQGLAYDRGSGNFYLTGYMNDKSASPILIVNKKTRKLVNAVRMTNPDGSDFTGHAGGLTIMNGKIYIAGSSDSCLYVFEKTAVDKAPLDSYLAYSAVVTLGDGNAKNDGIKVAYTTTQNGMVYAGEFYRDPGYILSEKHRVETPDGLQYALAVGFTLQNNNAKASVAYSIPNQIQGMCFSDDAIYLTTSWGLGKSKVYKYSFDSLIQSGTKQVCGETVPLYNLTLENMSDSWILPPMAEEIEYVDGVFYISNESASDKYVFGKFTGGRWCRAYSLK